MAALPAADHTSNTEMESSPRVAALPAPTLPEQPETNHPTSLELFQQPELTIVPISQSENTFEHLLTTLPSAVKIEELDFTFQQPPTATFDAELAHLHQ